MPPGLHGMLWSFLLWRDATRRAQVTTTETSTERRSIGTVGMPMTSYAYASRRKGLANLYSTIEPFCTTRRLASLIREQALGEVRRAMYSRTLQKGSGRPRRRKRRTHRPQPRIQGKYLGIWTSNRSSKYTSWEIL